MTKKYRNDQNRCCQCLEIFAVDNLNFQQREDTGPRPSPPPTPSSIGTLSSKVRDRFECFYEQAPVKQQESIQSHNRFAFSRRCKNHRGIHPRPGQLPEVKGKAKQPQTKAYGREKGKIIVFVSSVRKTCIYFPATVWSKHE